MAIGAYEFGYRVFAEPAMSEEPGITISVSITEDMDTMAVGKLLESKGLIRDARLFYVQEIVSEYKDKIDDVKDLIYILENTDENGLLSEDQIDSLKDKVETLASDICDCI